ncbi:cation diffusion facilitator family transporter [Kocuria carniphila]|uniref:Cation diffusion facilitator family transporter n=1 Tax=Kocuria carniphila TaxID=262208 RepID=A0ABV3V427_9MICC|nr:cation diffusion facilitator family transporter [Kocuria sp. cx-116]MBD2763301.1 cation diffusion facilitator family transporter [Kocuria sp. cx-116]
MKRMESPADNEHLPDEISRAVKRAVRLEWVTLGTLSLTVVVVFLVLGNSQAMKTAWIEDMLSLVPPLAFLISVRVTRKPANAKHPFGYHRAIGIAHLVAGTTLLVMGSYLIVDSLIKLLTVEHPTIGGISLFGHTIWLGWLMILVLLITGIPPVILGHMKLKLAEPLHNKVLYADADMNKADWMTSFAAIVGIAGIGLGLWWADAVAAIVIATSIVKDGASNLSAAVSGLMDARPTTVDNKKPHPLISDAQEFLQNLDWVHAANVRLRDEGQVFQIEGFVIPASRELATPERLEAAESALLDQDWKIRDVVIAPVTHLPNVVESK